MAWHEKQNENKIKCNEMKRKYEAGMKTKCNEMKMKWKWMRWNENENDN